MPCALTAGDCRLARVGVTRLVYDVDGWGAGELWLDDACNGPGSIVFIPRDTKYAVRGGEAGARFFRVVRGFVLQFGLPGDPQLGRAWSSQVIPDDPVRRPNRRGTVAFASAGPNTRTTQLFINLADNLRLDALGFAPIGQVAERLGIVDSLYAQYGERPSQDSIRLQGNAYLTRAYPNLDYIRTARIVREWR